MLLGNDPTFPNPLYVDNIILLYTRFVYTEFIFDRICIF